VEGIVFASMKWIETFRSPPDNDDDEDARAESAPRPARPVHEDLDEAFDEALDDVMARFTKALEHLAK
jgi:hypothetical protein